MGRRPVFELPTDSTAKPASIEGFCEHANIALDRALSERYALGKSDYIDPKSVNKPLDRNGRPMGVLVYEAYHCRFNVMRQSNVKAQTARLTLKVDLRAKATRTSSVLDAINNDSSGRLSPQQQAAAKRK